jgi:PilZ domain
MPQAVYSRRRHGRVQVNEPVYAFWSCKGRDGLSRIRDIGGGGLFLEAPITESLGTLVSLHFLVKEGQIRAEAVVRHVKFGQGVGLKFAALNERDWERFTALTSRLRTENVLPTGQTRDSTYAHS